MIFTAWKETERNRKQKEIESNRDKQKETERNRKSRKETEKTENLPENPEKNPENPQKTPENPRQRDRYFFAAYLVNIFIGLVCSRSIACIAICEAGLQ